MTAQDGSVFGVGVAPVVYLSGHFVEPAEATVSVFDHGFAYGDGIFETMRADQGDVRFLADHAGRLERSLTELGIEPPPEAGRLGEIAAEAVERLGVADAYIKVIVTRGVGELDPASCAAPTFVLIARPLRLPRARDYASGVRAISLWAEHPGGRPGWMHKSLSYMRSVLAKREITAAGAFEGFFTDAAGSLLEGAVSNVFAVSGGVLVTAPAGLCLPGVIRGRVLEAAVAQGVAVDERPIDRAALTEATEAFITNSLVGVLALRAVDELELPASPGPVTTLLAAAVEEAAIAHA